MPTLRIHPVLRPFTASLSPAVVELILLASPARCEEHLIQGWDALSAAGRTEDGGVYARNMAFARARLTGAQATLYGVGTGEREAAEREIAALGRLIEETR